MPWEFGTNHARFFESGNSWPKFWTVQNFWAEFPIDLRIARTHYGLCESVKTITNWVRFSHESKYLSIRVNSWDSGPVWNRGIKDVLLWWVRKIGFLSTWLIWWSPVYNCSYSHVALLDWLKMFSQHRWTSVLKYEMRKLFLLLYFVHNHSEVTN